MFNNNNTLSICMLFFSVLCIACAEDLSDAEDEMAGTSDGGSNAGMNTSNEEPSSHHVGSIADDDHPWLDSICLDGQYQEELPDMNVDLSMLINQYDPQNAVDFLIEVLQKRYPLGAYLVAEGLQADFGNCVEFFLRDRSSAQAIFEQISTLVHECGHFADLDAGGFSNSIYIITQNLRITCSEGDTTDRGGQTFARSLLNNDMYALPSCQRGESCDFYRDVYLNGDPMNQEFEGGDQGYNSLIEETLQYINSIAVSDAFSNELSGRFASERDGILTFLWYMLRYLHMARLDYPQAYDKISNDPCWRELVLTLWGRAWLYLDVSADLEHLGINDEVIEERLLPELVEEIDLLRELQCY